MLLMPRDVQPERTTPYSVPRRFGIGSMLMVTLAFGLVFTALRAIGLGLAAVLGTTVFLMAIGVAQSLYDRRPREVSIVTGSLLFPTFAIIGWALESEGRFADFSGMNVLGSGFLFLLLAPLGMFVGYFAGLFLATVFMLIDMFMSAALNRKRDVSQESGDARIGGVEVVLREDRETASEGERGTGWGS